MTLTRRKAFLSLAIAPMTTLLGAEGGAGAAEASVRLLGTWHVTSAVTSVILSIEPSGEALGMLIENGAHSMWRTRWRKLEGGILVEGLPMFRLWPGRNGEEARVEMEPMPDDMDVSGGMKQFPLAFFMRRVAMISKGSMGRKIPQNWESGSLPAEWDPKAGRRRTLGK